MNSPLIINKINIRYTDIIMILAKNNENQKLLLFTSTCYTYRELEKQIWIRKCLMEKKLFY